MAGSTEYSSQSQVNEKADIQPQDSSDLEQHYDHLEVAGMGDSASVAESEKDIPVRGQIQGADRHTDFIT